MSTNTWQLSKLLTDENGTYVLFRMDDGQLARRYYDEEEGWTEIQPAEPGDERNIIYEQT